MKPIIESEAQFLFVCHLVGPLLQRFHNERTRCIMELTLALYELLVAVDHKTASSSSSSGDNQHLYAMDPICDFLYHIKYMFVGDGVRAEAERSIRRSVGSVVLTGNLLLRLMLSSLSSSFRASSSSSSSFASDCFSTSNYIHLLPFLCPTVCVPRFNCAYDSFLILSIPRAPTRHQLRIAFHHLLRVPDPTQHRQSSVPRPLPG